MNNIIECMLYKVALISKGTKYILYADIWLSLHISLICLKVFDYETY